MGLVLNWRLYAPTTDTQTPQKVKIKETKPQH